MVRGIRQPIPPGYILGRTGQSAGEAQLIPISTLAKQIASSGGSGGVWVEQNGVLVARRSQVNFIAGTGVTLTAVDNPSANRVDVTVNASGASAYTTPLSANFSWTNQATAAVADTTTGMVLTKPKMASVNVSLLKDTNGYYTTPFTITMGIRTSFYSGSNPTAGIYIRDSSTGKFVEYSARMASSTNSPLVEIGYWTNPTTFSSSPASVVTGDFVDFLSIKDDGTNFTFSLGRELNALSAWTASISRTAFLATPNEVGVYINDNASEALASAVFHYKKS